MRLKFKIQDYQTAAVDAVVDCFDGQPPHAGHQLRSELGTVGQTEAFGEGICNNDIRLEEDKILQNIQAVQERQNLPLSTSLNEFTGIGRKGKISGRARSYRPGAKINLDIEMETGTGKSYCYIKTIFEMSQRYGWSRFVVMVPSVAIREGVYKSFQITADHFSEIYGRKARYFAYNSKRMHELESFASDAGINVMIINIQAFNSRSTDNLRIFETLDDFQSRRPIDVISSAHPILILDEPQKMGGSATLDALPKFNPLMILRYSATHRINHVKIYRLDALDAYNQKLVKRIAVRGVRTQGLGGESAYLYLEGIDISERDPVARIELEIKQMSGKIERRMRRLTVGNNLFDVSRELEQYRDFTIAEIDFGRDTVEFANGLSLHVGDTSGDVTEEDIRRIQIRETVRAHFDKETRLFPQGIKTMSLFFIDEVAKYRDYSRNDEKGEYARIFEIEYGAVKEECLADLAADKEEYRAYLKSIDAGETHRGYFAIDKRSGRDKNPTMRTTGEGAGLSDDVDAYNLILRDKERLLSVDEPTRFIFSHSALREGWDNPNIFGMCMLKHSSSMISRRQEVGRGLRIAVNQRGERTDRPSTVHDINVLTVVAGESYEDFVAGLQAEISETLVARRRKVSAECFANEVVDMENRRVEISARMARQLFRWLLCNDYLDDDHLVTDLYRTARVKGSLADLPDDLRPLADGIGDLVDKVADDGKSPRIEDGRSGKTNRLNDNFKKREFQELWSRINRKAVYRVDFESTELIRNCVTELDRKLEVAPVRYLIQGGEQRAALTDGELNTGRAFRATESDMELADGLQTNVRRDLIGEVAKNVQLTRKTVAEILTRIRPESFLKYRQNPEQFIAKASKLIIEQKATTIVERLRYDLIMDRYDSDIFTAAQMGQDFARATGKLNRHVYDYCITDSDVEREFVEKLDGDRSVVVYAKLPRGFFISTPVGEYNPDWAIMFRRGTVKEIYFIAETKGSVSSMELRKVENIKIGCARKFFATLNNFIEAEGVRYEMIANYEQLMGVVAGIEMTESGGGCTKTDE